MTKLVLEIASLLSIAALLMANALILTWIGRLFSLRGHNYHTAFITLLISGATAVAAETLVSLSDQKPLAPIAATLTGFVVFYYLVRKSSQSTPLKTLGVLAVLALSTSLLSPPVIRLVYVTLQPIRMTGDEMTPTIRNGEYLITVPLDEPRRGDIVLFNTQHQDRCIARLIALPGENVHLEDRSVSINGQRLEEPFWRVPTFNDLTVTLSSNEYFALVDNTSTSRCDSRSLGPIRRNVILTRVRYKTSSLYRLPKLIDL